MRSAVMLEGLRTAFANRNELLSWSALHETIYRSLFVQTRGVLKKELPGPSEFLCEAGLSVMSSRIAR